MKDNKTQIKSWIRSQHLICEGSDFIFETVDQTPCRETALFVEPLT